MLVYIRGAGSVASGIAFRLYHANCRIVMSDLEHPQALRRNVCFSEALRTGRTVVEGVEAVAAKDVEEVVQILRKGSIAVMKDPEGDLRGTLPFDACVDAIFAETDPDTYMMDAPIVIGVGEQFVPGKNCHAAVTAFLRGSTGRVRYEADGMHAAGPSREMGNTSAYIQVPREGLFYPVSEIGDLVKKGETVAVVDNEPLISPVDGLIAGILAEGTPVVRNRICAEIQQHAEADSWKHISERALAIGGGVLEALLHFRETY
ncbi:MAG: molybdenum hydroxylase [Eubacterium sp.]|nr:molybdenum hydroxylase [Eubacterium sp.]